jgi:hypothetical protein
LTILVIVVTIGEERVWPWGAREGFWARVVPEDVPPIARERSRGVAATVRRARFTRRPAASVACRARRCERRLLVGCDVLAASTGVPAGGLPAASGTIAVVNATSAEDGALETAGAVLASGLVVAPGEEAPEVVPVEASCRVVDSASSALP